MSEPCEVISHLPSLDDLLSLEEIVMKDHLLYFHLWEDWNTDDDKRTVASLNEYGMAIGVTLPRLLNWAIRCKVRECGGLDGQNVLDQATPLVNP
jgi:hypothetical protein